MKTAWYTKKWVIIVIHALLWLFLFSLPYLLKPSYNNNPHPEPHHNIVFDILYLLNCTSWIVLFYVNAHVLIPKLIFNKKYWFYFLLKFGIIGALFFFNWLFFRIFLNQLPFSFIVFLVFNIFPYIFIMTASTAYQMFRNNLQTEKRTKEKETENLKTELLFLRSQVSPHFMFNVLNNMVSLARKKSDLLEPSLIKLSSLMRYMLYETDERKVSLEKEVDYLQSYIDLQQQRFGKNIKVQVCLHQVDGNYTIEPMLLIPFVENAFKHGTGVIADAQILIELSVTNGMLQLMVQNKYDDAAQETKDDTSGIGLNNVKRRLNLLYPNHHTLLIRKSGGWYMVSLQLNLH